MKERHTQIIEAIKGFYLEHGFCPTIRQIGDMVGLKSTSTTITHLKAMEEAGLIIRNEFSPRSIIIPGFNDKKPGNDNVFLENETQTGGFDTVYVLHGHWSMPGEDGVEVWGVSPDLEMLQESMGKTGDQMVEEARFSEMEIKFDTVETSGTKYEAENNEGYYIRIYITEHKVEGGTKRHVV